MADPVGANQLISGFHAIEASKWRWTKGQFALALKPPPGAEKNGARLRFKLYVPEDQLRRVGPFTLRAEAGSQQLAPETYSKEGEYVYSRQISSVPATNLLPVRFTLDKSAPPAMTDGRELGVVALSASLDPN